MEILTFLLGEDKYALDISAVETIENIITTTKVPNGKEYLIGLINIRGETIPLIDTSILLKIDTQNPEYKKIIIIKYNSENIALAVSDIDNVLNISEDDLNPLNNSTDDTVINNDNEIITLITKNQFKILN